MRERDRTSHEKGEHERMGCANLPLRRSCFLPVLHWSTSAWVPVMLWIVVIMPFSILRFSCITCAEFHSEEGMETIASLINRFFSKTKVTNFFVCSALVSTEGILKDLE